MAGTRGPFGWTGRFFFIGVDRGSLSTVYASFLGTNGSLSDESSSSSTTGFTFFGLRGALAVVGRFGVISDERSVVGSDFCDLMGDSDDFFVSVLLLSAFRLRRFFFSYDAICAAEGIVSSMTLAKVEGMSIVMSS